MRHLAGILPTKSPWWYPSLAFPNIQGHTIFASPLTQDSVVLDLGSNRGHFANEVNKHYGGVFYLVEPNPVLAETLRVENHFPVWQCAVATRDQPVSFNIAQNDEGSSILSLPEQSIHNCVLQQTIEVPAKRLETLIAETGARRIDLVKMDIEGAEVAVLRSLPEVTLRMAIGQISVEFHGDSVFGFHLDREVEEVIRYLRRCGFLCLDFSGSRSRRNVLFINRSLHSISWLQGITWEWRVWFALIRKSVPKALQTKLHRLRDRVTGMATRK
jgi:FkbM family methyltransferase